MKEALFYASLKEASEVIKNKYMTRNKKLYRLKKLGFSDSEAMHLIPFDPERDFN